MGVEMSSKQCIVLCADQEAARRWREIGGRLVGRRRSLLPVQIAVEADRGGEVSVAWSDICSASIADECE